MEGARRRATEPSSIAGMAALWSIPRRGLPRARRSRPGAAAARSGWQTRWWGRLALQAMGGFVRFGYLALNDAGGIRPDVLARELEQRGFDSVWMPEHSHIPSSRETPYPGGGDLPNGYWQMM